MKIGEFWRDIEDGTIVKITDINYSIDFRDYIVYYEDVEKDWGNYLERTDFLRYYELYG